MSQLHHNLSVERPWHEPRDDASLEERVLLQEIHRLIMRMRVFCDEVQQIDYDVALFVAEYCKAVAPVLQEIRTLEAVIARCAILPVRESVEAEGLSLSVEKTVAREYHPSPVRQSVDDGAEEAERKIPNVKPGTTLQSFARKSDKQRYLAGEVQKLYRALAKEFHPDLCEQTNAADSARDDVIKRLNVAYDKKNLGMLWAVAFEQVWLDGRQGPEPKRLKLLRYYQRKLLDAFSVVSLTRERVMCSPDYELQQKAYRATLRGKDAIAELQGRFEEERAQKQRRVRYLQATGRDTASATAGAAADVQAFA